MRSSWDWRRTVVWHIRTVWPVRGAEQSGCRRASLLRRILGAHRNRWPGVGNELGGHGSTRPRKPDAGAVRPAPAPALTSGWEGEPSSSSRECLRAANRYAAASQCRKLHRLADSVLALIAHAVRPTGRRRPIRDSGSSRSEVQWCLGGHGLDTCGDNSVDALRAGLPRSGSASAGHPGWRST
jgi:hypothetical protein